ncbi:hypothetical protein SK128_020025 [Halocaridina rubra]|uniref:SHSP domain-containing protein n=1 Tax=Halocaridina rubra TaxID=373956 RepID=A0AAN8WJD4_HALRR
MAPVRTERSSASSYSATEAVTNTRRQTNINVSRVFSLAPKERNLCDNLFRNTRSRYNNRIRRLLSDWEESDDFGDEFFNFASRRSVDRFHSNRFRFQTDDSEGVYITVEDGSIKLLLDVSEILAEDIKVRVVDEREVDVEFTMRQDSLSKFESMFQRKLCYRITFPRGTNLDRATSELSPTGILSILAPIKMPERLSYIQASTGTEANAEKTKTESSTYLKYVNNVGAKLEDTGSMIPQKTTCMHCKQPMDNKELSSLEEGINIMHLTSSETEKSLEPEAAQEISTGRQQFLKHSIADDSGDDDSLLNKVSITRIYDEEDVNEASCLLNDTFEGNTHQKHLLVNKIRLDLGDPSFETLLENSYSNGNAASEWKKEIRAFVDQCCAESSEHHTYKELEDHSKYMFLLGVHGAKADSIYAKLIDNKEIVICTLEEEERAITSSQESFHKQILLPRDTHLDMINILLTNDGYLVIILPKKAVKSQACEIVVPILMDNDEADTLLQSETKSSDDEKYSNLDIDSCQISRTSFSSSKERFYSNDTQAVSVQRDCSSLTLKKDDFLNVTVTDDHGTEHNDTKDKDACPKITETSNTEKTIILTDDGAREHPVIEKISSENKPDSTFIPQSSYMVSNEAEEGQTAATSVNGDSTLCISTKNIYKVFPVSKKGPFFEDCHFRKEQNYLLSAIGSRFPETISLSVASGEVLDCWRAKNLDQCVESQSTSFEDEENFKFILDVHQFADLEVAVDICKMEIVVKGTWKESEVGARNVIKCFTVNQEGNFDSSFSSLSSDGILVITVPKKISRYHASSTNVYKETLSEPSNESCGIEMYKQSECECASTAGGYEEFSGFSSSAHCHIQRVMSMNTDDSLVREDLAAANENSEVCQEIGTEYYEDNTKQINHDKHYIETDNNEEIKSQVLICQKKLTELEISKRYRTQEKDSKLSKNTEEGRTSSAHISAAFTDESQTRTLDEDCIKNDIGDVETITNDNQLIVKTCENAKEERRELILSQVEVCTEPDISTIQGDDFKEILELSEDEASLLHTIEKTSGDEGLFREDWQCTEDQKVVPKAGGIKDNLRVIKSKTTLISENCDLYNNNEITELMQEDNTSMGMNHSHISQEKRSNDSFHSEHNGPEEIALTESLQRGVADSQDISDHHIGNDHGGIHVAKADSVISEVFQNESFKTINSHASLCVDSETEVSNAQHGIAHEEKVASEAIALLTEGNQYECVPTINSCGNLCLERKFDLSKADSSSLAVNTELSAVKTPMDTSSQIIYKDLDNDENKTDTEYKASAWEVRTDSSVEESSQDRINQLMNVDMDYSENDTRSSDYITMCKCSDISEVVMDVTDFVQATEEGSTDSSMEESFQERSSQLMNVDKDYSENNDSSSDYATMCKSSDISEAVFDIADDVQAIEERSTDTTNAFVNQDGVYRARMVLVDDCASSFDDENNSVQQATGGMRITENVHSCKIYDDGSISVPVTKRGPFSEDIFFEGMQIYLLKKVREILSKHGDDAANSEDEFSRYRYLCSRNADEKPERIFISFEDDAYFKVIIDVYGFSEERGIKIFINNEWELFVEGYVENKACRYASANLVTNCVILSKNLDIHTAVAGLSSDGILAVKLHKKVLEDKSCSTNYNVISTSSKCGSHTECNEAIFQKSSHQACERMPYKMSYDKVNKEFTREGLFASEEQYLCSRRSISLTRRGMFFEDPFFDVVHDSFRKALRKVLLKSREEDKCNHTSEMASYKCLRKLNPTVENQAFFIDEDMSSFKVVIDIQSLMEDSMSVFEADERTLVIEGQLNEGYGIERELQVLSQSVPLPDHVQLDAITAALSSDGILFFVTPKE